MIDFLFSMPNKNYERGRRFEYTVLNKLKSIGYDGMRSAGSHTAIDLIVWKEGEGIRFVGYNKFHQLMLDFFAIQCKHSIVGDVNFVALLKDENVRKLAVMPDNFTKVLCIKQPRSKEIIQLVYDNPNWKYKKIFDI